MEEMAFQSEEIKRISENPEQDATRNLEQTTLEPATRVEQAGDIVQAENIQASLTEVTANMASAPVESAVASQLGSGADAVETLPGPLPSIDVQSATQASGSLTGAEAVEVLPNPLPSIDVQSATQVSGSLTGAEAVEVLPNPLPSIDVQSATQASVSLTGAETVEVLPNPLPDIGIQVNAASRVADDDEGVQTNTLDGVIRATSTAPLETAAEAKGIGNMPIPIPDIAQVQASFNSQVLSEVQQTGDLPTPHPDLTQAGRSATLDIGNMQDQVGETSVSETVFEKAVPFNSESAAQVSGEVFNSPVESVAGIEDVVSVLNEASAFKGNEWKPPTMYAHVNQDGSISVLGADGKKLDSPPIISTSIGPDGITHYYATYPDGSGAGVKFEIPPYSTRPSGMYVYQGADGSFKVVDANGKPVDNGPVITVTTGADGKTEYLATYPGSDPSRLQTLPAYTGAMDPRMYNQDKVESSKFSENPSSPIFVYQADDGSLRVVDAHGKPVDSPPLITVSTGADGKLVYTASYPGSETKVTLSAYSGSMEGLYIAKDINGNLIVVDKNGMKVDCPPLISHSMGSDGKIIYSATYPGEEFSVVLEKYEFSPGGLSVYVGQDGKMTILDKNGTPMDAQWKVEKYQGWYYIYMADSDQTYEGYTQVKAFSQPITGMFIHLGQDGNPQVVDANGKPIALPPQITSFVDSKGQVCYSACYPDSQPSILGYYKPPSGS